MTQRNFSSYLSIIYLLTVVFCISIIHLSEVISSHYHREGIRKIDQQISTNKPKKKQKRSTPEGKKIEKKTTDSLSQVESAKPEKKDVYTENLTKTADADFFADLLEKYEVNRTTSANKLQSRTDIVIRYYKKNKDVDKVYKLRDLGFYIHERTSEEDFDGYASNAIFYGDSVKREDLMIIAYSLLNNGFNLQSVTLSKFHDAWKAHSVEIGTDTTALSDKPITLSSLRKKWKDM